MTDRLHPVLRVLTGLLAILTALAAVAIFVGSLGVLSAVGGLVGLAGVIAALILLRLAITGKRLNRVDTAIAMVGTPLAWGALVVMMKGVEDC